MCWAMRRSWAACRNRPSPPTPRPGLRRRHRRPAGRPQASGPDPDQYVPGNLVSGRLRHLRRQRLSTRQGRAGGRSGRGRHQPARRRGRLPQPGAVCQFAGSGFSVTTEFSADRRGTRGGLALMLAWRRPRPRRKQPVCHYAVTGDAIAIVPDRDGRATPSRGRMIVASRSIGLCLLCHSGPIPEAFPGDTGAQPGGCRGALVGGSTAAAYRRWHPSQSRHHHAGLLSDHGVAARRQGLSPARRS